jgi:hypothetical protein
MHSIRVSRTGRLSLPHRHFLGSPSAEHTQVQAWRTTGTVPSLAQTRDTNFSLAIIIIIFMDYAIRGLFRPLEKCADPSILTVDVLRFVFFFGCMLEFWVAF